MVMVCFENVRALEGNRGKLEAGVRLQKTKDKDTLTSVPFYPLPSVGQVSETGSCW